jgi:hypothetical protein
VVKEFIKSAKTRIACSNFIRTSIHDEYDLMLFWHIFGLSCRCK